MSSSPFETGRDFPSIREAREEIGMGLTAHGPAQLTFSAMARTGERHDRQPRKACDEQRSKGRRRCHFAVIVGAKCIGMENIEELIDTSAWRELA